MNRLWWTSNVRYFLYFLRELSGPVIAAWTLYFLISWVVDPSFGFVSGAVFAAVTWATFAFSLIHTLTWLFVTTKLTGIPRPSVRLGLFLILIGIWIGLSIFLLNFFYDIPIV